MSKLCDSDGFIWIKDNNHTFNVTMRSFMGAEICDLIGLQIFHDLQVLPCYLYGFYHDNGIAIFDNHSKCDKEITSKNIIEIFKKHNFKIEIEKGMLKTDFLDGILSLRVDIYESFKKKSWKIVYTHNQSNYPRLIRKCITPMVSKLFGKLSSKKNISLNVVRNLTTKFSLIVAII